MSSTDWGERFAAVRYTDLKPEVVFVKNVKHFYPKHYGDFKMTENVYKIRTDKWNPDGEDQLFLGAVEGLGATREAAEAARKASHLNLSKEEKASFMQSLRSYSIEPQVSSGWGESDAEGPVGAAERQLEEKRILKESNKDLDKDLAMVIRKRLRPTVKSSSGVGTVDSSDGEQEQECNSNRGTAEPLSAPRLHSGHARSYALQAKTPRAPAPPACNLLAAVHRFQKLNFPFRWPLRLNE